MIRPEPEIDHRAVQLLYQLLRVSASVVRNADGHSAFSLLIRHNPRLHLHCQYHSLLHGMFDGVFHKGLDTENRYPAVLCFLFDFALQQNRKSALDTVNITVCPDLLHFLLHSHRLSLIPEHIPEIRGKRPDHIIRGICGMRFQQRAYRVETVQKKVGVYLKLVILKLNLFHPLSLPELFLLQAHHPLKHFIDLPVNFSEFLDLQSLRQLWRFRISLFRYHLVDSVGNMLNRVEKNALNFL